MPAPAVPFEPGSVVYEPFLGLCRVTDSAQETMLGVEQLFYILQPRQGASVIKVPAGQMVSRGIRYLLAPAEIERALSPQQPLESQTTSENSQQRLQRWTQLVRSEGRLGSYEFLRECHGLATQGVPLSLQETEMQVKVRKSLSQEIAQVLEISPGRATTRLNDWLQPEKPKKEKKKK